MELIYNGEINAPDTIELVNFKSAVPEMDSLLELLSKGIP